jgi:hypothetical protein
MLLQLRLQESTCDTSVWGNDCLAQCLHKCFAMCLFVRNLHTRTVVLAFLLRRVAISSVWQQTVSLCA